MQSFDDTDCVLTTYRTTNILTTFRQRDLVLAFCTLVEVSRRSVEHLYPGMEIHLDDVTYKL